MRQALVQVQMMIIIKRGNRSLKFMLFTLSISKLHVAGNILPAVSRDFGSILVGNIIPESISDGRNMNCDTIVSFDVVLIVRPKMAPMLKLVIMKIASIIKYIAVFFGRDASKAIGAIKYIIMLIIKRCTNAEIKLFIIGMHMGIPPILYDFFSSLP